MNISYYLSTLLEQRFALVDDQICDKICIPKLTLVLHIPTVNLAKVFLFVPSICFFITSVKSPKSQGSKFRFKSQDPFRTSLFSFCVGGVLVVVCLFVCLLTFV